ncbi:hypothetical protein MHYP_G00347510 [Metynnis hypsauchen]
MGLAEEERPTMERPESVASGCSVGPFNFKAVEALKSLVGVETKALWKKMTWQQGSESMEKEDFLNPGHFSPAPASLEGFNQDRKS